MSTWRETLDELVRQRGRVLFGYAYMLSGDRPSAEDLVQDALVRAFRSGRHARSLDAAHAYVKRAIATAFIDSTRRAQRRPKIDSRVDGLDAWMRQHPAAVDHSARVNDAVDLQTALLALSPRERTCVVLRYLEDMSTSQVAEVLGLAEGSVKRYVADGIEKLREALPHLHFHDEETVPVQAQRRVR